MTITRCHEHQDSSVRFIKGSVCGKLWHSVKYERSGVILNLTQMKKWRRFLPCRRLFTTALLNNCVAANTYLYKCTRRLQIYSWYFLCIFLINFSSYNVLISVIRLFWGLMLNMSSAASRLVYTITALWFHSKPLRKRTVKKFKSCTLIF